MDFQQFKNYIEAIFKDKVAFELVEFRFLPYSFGNGTLVLRVHGFVFRFIYDGRDNILICERSNKHEKYPRCIWDTLFQNLGFILNEKQIELLLQ
jgi:hypothetical protein